MCACVKTSVEVIISKGGLRMCEPNDFLSNLRVFTFWFDRESIMPGNLGFAVSVCRLRERGRMSKRKSVCVCVS